MKGCRFFVCFYICKDYEDIIIVTEKPSSLPMAFRRSVGIWWYVVLVIICGTMPVSNLLCRHSVFQDRSTDQVFAERMVTICGL